MAGGLTASEVAIITGRPAGGDLVQVRGLGGIGKSLLAEEYALRFGAAYPGGVFWLRAYGHDDARAMLRPEARAAERDRQLRGFALKLGVEVTDRAPDEVEAALA